MVIVEFDLWVFLMFENWFGFEIINLFIIFVIEEGYV